MAANPWVAGQIRNQQPGLAGFVGLLAIVVAVLAVPVGVMFMVEQRNATPPGIVQVGIGGSGCSLGIRRSELTTETIGYRIVYHFNRPVVEGEPVTVRILKNGSVDLSRTTPMPAAGDCLAQEIGPDDFDPGHYRFESLARDEELAVGEFDVVAYEATP
jgi:hypothetical protein